MRTITPQTSTKPPADLLDAHMNTTAPRTALKASVLKNSVTAGLIAIFFCFSASSVWAEQPQQHSAATQAAQKVLDRFMTTFNQRDMKGWAATLNYPHVRFASGTVTVWDSKEEFSKTPPFKALAKIGWDHSHWRSREVIMASPAKVHIATTFERFNKSNESIGVYQSLYIVTRVNGDWGITSRSSLAP